MRKILRISLALLLICIMAYGSNVNGTVNTGDGTQRFVEPLSEDTNIMSKGTYIGFFADYVTVRAGSWITVGFGVIDTAYSESCEASFEGHVEFLQDVNVYYYWDGELIEDLYDPANPDYTEIVDQREDGSCMTRTQHNFYIPPQSLGEHSFDTEFYIFGQFWFGSFNTVEVVPAMR